MYLMRVGQVPGYIDGFTSLQLRPLRTCNTINNVKTGSIGLSCCTSSWNTSFLRLWRARNNMTGVYFFNCSKENKTMYIFIFVYQKSSKRKFKTGFWVQDHLFNLCSSAVSSQRLLFSQKAGVKRYVWFWHLKSTILYKNNPN